MEASDSEFTFSDVSLCEMLDEVTMMYSMDLEGTKKRITLDINYNFGLSKMFDALNETSLGETFDFSNIDNTKQNMFMVTVGIKLL